MTIHDLIQELLKIPNQEQEVLAYVRTQDADLITYGKPKLIKYARGVIIYGEDQF